MSRAGKNILIKFKKRWQLLLWLKIFLYAIGIAVLVFSLSRSIFWAGMSFLLVSGIMAVVLKPWKIGIHSVSSYLDQNHTSLEFSSGLLLEPQENLTGVGRLQQQRVAAQVAQDIKRINPDINIQKAAIITAFLGAIAVGIYQVDFNQFRNTESTTEKTEVVLRPADSISEKMLPPKIISQQVTINYPAYTGVAAFSSENMNITAVEGSRISWKIQFGREVDSAQMESMGNRYVMEFKENFFGRTAVMRNSGFYNFRFKDAAGGTYISDLFSVEVTRDRAPEIEIENLPQFISFNFDEVKNFSFNTKITDDFGISKAYIIATVSKGTGEAVKFREERLEFEQPVKKGEKRQELLKKMDLDSLKMEPGDELYFFVEAIDLKQPQPNIARSETYFAVIQDTVSYGAGVEGTMGVDLMPDYFRSQRQLIIDTEKLIGNRDKIPSSQFNATSNDLGFDQKALRLRYGQFMGDETEGISSNEVQETEENEDPLAAFTHDHDGDNEHNLVPHEHEHEHEEEETNGEQKDPLAEFLHDHGDPEAATLFTDSLRSQLRQALDIMWDAELHLRLNEPEKSLPYQYRALNLLQKIKNSARIYVHRIGYEPAPIREDARLTGKIDEVSNFSKVEELQKADDFKNIRLAVKKLEQVVNANSKLTAADRQLLEKAGNELAALAIDEPGQHLGTLQQLNRLTGERAAKMEEFTFVLQGLLKALPKPEANPGKEGNFRSELNELLIKEMQENDR